MDKAVTCVDIYGETFEILSSDLMWRPSAYAIVIKNDELLLSKQFGKYDLPGGGVDIGEKIESAVIREVKEETGLDVIKPELVAIENNFFRASQSDKSSYHSILIYFSCEMIGGELSTEGFVGTEIEHGELAEWVPIEKLDEIEILSTVDFRNHVKNAYRKIIHS